MSETELRFKSCWRAPGYRDLDFVLIDKGGREYRLRLPPADVQRVIFECADAAKQIGDHPPLDWDRWPATIYWPVVTPWKAGETRTVKSQEASS